MRMLMVLFVAGAASCIAVSGNAQGLGPAVNYSTSVLDGRFEIVQSSLIARQTFEVDKYTGNVYQLVGDSKGNSIGWELIPRERIASDETKPGQVNYQLFMSGIAARYTFLVNIWTRATWQLVTDNKGNLLWQAMY